jgi:hypothetical protein
MQWSFLCWTAALIHVECYYVSTKLVVRDDLIQCSRLWELYRFYKLYELIIFFCPSFPFVGIPTIWQLSYIISWFCIATFVIVSWNAEYIYFCAKFSLSLTYETCSHIQKAHPWNLLIISILRSNILFFCLSIVASCSDFLSSKIIYQHYDEPHRKQWANVG